MHKIKITKLSGVVLATLLLGASISAVLCNTGALLSQNNMNPTTSSNSLSASTGEKSLYNFAQTSSVSIDVNDGRTTKNYNITNHMQDVLSFQYKDKLYYAICNSEGDLILYNNKFDMVNKFVLKNLIYSTSSHQKSIPEIIEDVIPSSDGHYLYIAVLFDDPVAHQRGDIIYKMNVEGGQSQKLYTMD